MTCARNKCGKEFRARRGWQKYCSRYCRQKAYDERVPLKRVRRSVATPASARKRVVRRILEGMDAQSPVRRRAMPLEANGTFTHQAAPGNIKGLLARVAVGSPRVMLKLAALGRREGDASQKGR